MYLFVYFRNYWMQGENITPSAPPLSAIYDVLPNINGNTAAENNHYENVHSDNKNGAHNGEFSFYNILTLKNFT